MREIINSGGLSVHGAWLMQPTELMMAPDMVDDRSCVAAFHAATTATIIVDVAARIRFANLEPERLFGRNPRGLERV